MLHFYWVIKAECVNPLNSLITQCWQRSVQNILSMSNGRLLSDTCCVIRLTLESVVDVAVCLFLRQMYAGVTVRHQPVITAVEVWGLHSTCCNYNHCCTILCWCMFPMWSFTILMISLSTAVAQLLIREMDI